MNSRVLIIFILFPLFLHAAESGPIRKTAAVSVTTEQFAWFDANRIRSRISNVGDNVAARGNGANAGMTWPRGTEIPINYQSGIWIAGMVDSSIRIAAAEYVSEYVPGTYADWNDTTRADDFRIYVIDSTSGPGDIDYDEWPFADGAPADEFGNPKLYGSKTYWSVFTDMDSARHLPLFGTDPLGIEVRQTLWGYDRADGFGDMMFMRYVFLNASSETIDDAYFSFWTDIDLGDHNDFIASDTSLSLGYHYEKVADVIYGTETPAIGYDLFQGPIVPSPGDTATSFGKQQPDYRNLGMTSFPHFVRGGGPWERDPETASEVYNYMQGLGGQGNIRVDDLGNATKYSYTGDPVAGTGWIREEWGDFRFLLTSGPFTMLAGDSQEVFAAVIIALGSSALNSVTALKAQDSVAQILYDSDFEVFISVGVDDDEIFTPSGWSLEQNYPNPFNPVTKIVYSIPVRSDVSLIIYNLRGQEVTRLIDGEQTVGVYSVRWDAAGLSSSIYFYKLKARPTSGGQAGGFVETKKMVLLK